MMFSRKIYKLARGINPNLHATSQTEMTLFLFDGISKKCNLQIGEQINCFRTTTKYFANNVCKVDDEKIILCLYDNIKIIEDK